LGISALQALFKVVILANMVAVALIYTLLQISRTHIFHSVNILNKSPTRYGKYGLSKFFAQIAMQQEQYAVAAAAAAAH
jgi:ABC-type sugar transport system permease subunit